MTSWPKKDKELEAYAPKTPQALSDASQNGTLATSQQSWPLVTTSRKHLHHYQPCVSPGESPGFLHTLLATLTSLDYFTVFLNTILLLPRKVTVANNFFVSPKNLLKDPLSYQNRKNIKGQILPPNSLYPVSLDDYIMIPIDTDQPSP